MISRAIAKRLKNEPPMPSIAARAADFAAPLELLFAHQIYPKSGSHFSV
jgi:hypothetical protein